MRGTADCRRIASHTANPSIFGSITSSITRSNGRAAKRASASTPSAAPSTSCPSCSNSCTSASSRSASSSAMRIRATRAPSASILRKRPHYTQRLFASGLVFRRFRAHAPRNATASPPFATRPTELGGGSRAHAIGGSARETRLFVRPGLTQAGPDRRARCAPAPREVLPTPRIALSVGRKGPPRRPTGGRTGSGPPSTGSRQRWLGRGRSRLWQKITEIGRTAPRLSRRGLARPEGELRDQAFSQWAGRTQTPFFPISVIFCHGSALSAPSRRRRGRAGSPRTARSGTSGGPRPLGQSPPQHPVRGVRLEARRAWVRVDPGLTERNAVRGRK